MRRLGLRRSGALVGAIVFGYTVLVNLGPAVLIITAVATVVIVIVLNRVLPKRDGY